MKRPLKYNWFALFFMTSLVVAIFFVAMTGWRIDGSNDASASDVATAGWAATPLPASVWTAVDVPGTPDGIHAARSGIEKLKALERDGLPLPDNYTDYSGDGHLTHFHWITASSPSSPSSLTAFYRRELSARKWRELPAAAEGGGDTGILWFIDGHGNHLELLLIPNIGGGSDFGVSVESAGKAGEAGIQSQGRVPVYREAMTDEQAVSHGSDR